MADTPPGEVARADTRNRLATSGDFGAVVFKDKAIDIDDLKVYEIDTCINSTVLPVPIEPDQEVAEIAAYCIVPSAGDGDEQVFRHPFLADQEREHMSYVRLISGVVMVAGLVLGTAECTSIHDDAESNIHEVYGVATAAAYFIFAYILARAIENIPKRWPNGGNGGGPRSKAS